MLSLGGLFAIDLWDMLLGEYVVRALPRITRQGLYMLKILAKIFQNPLDKR